MIRGSTPRPFRFSATLCVFKHVQPKFSALVVPLSLSPPHRLFWVQLPVLTLSCQNGSHRFCSVTTVRYFVAFQVCISRVVREVSWVFLKWTRRSEALGLHGFVQFSGSRELGPIFVDRLRLLIGKQPADCLTIPATWPYSIQVTWAWGCLCFVLLHIFIVCNSGHHTWLLRALTISSFPSLVLFSPAGPLPLPWKLPFYFYVIPLKKKDSVYERKQAMIELWNVPAGSYFEHSFAVDSDVLQGPHYVWDVGF